MWVFIMQSALASYGTGLAEGIAMGNDENAGYVHESLTYLTNPKALLMKVKLEAAKALERVSSTYAETAETSVNDAVLLLGRIDTDQIARDVGAATGVGLQKTRRALYSANQGVQTVFRRMSRSVKRGISNTEDKARIDMQEIRELFNLYSGERNAFDKDSHRRKVQKSIEHFKSHYSQTIMEDYIDEISKMENKILNPDRPLQTIREMATAFIPAFTRRSRPKRKSKSPPARDAMRSLMGIGGTKRRKRTRR